MSSLLRDLTDMGIAVNPDVNTSESVSAQAKSKVVSIFESHWDKEKFWRLFILHLHVLLSRNSLLFEWRLVDVSVILGMFTYIHLVYYVKYKLT